MQEFQELNITTDKTHIYKNLSRDQYIEHSLKQGLGRLSADGALLVDSGEHTGRAANDKYLVESPKTNEIINWKNGLHKMSADTFSALKNHFIEQLSQSENIYLQKNSVSADPQHAIAIQIFTPSPYHAMFADHMFRDYKDCGADKTYTVLHLPYHKIDKERFHLNNSTAIVISMEERMVLIAGTRYCGEIKKSIFSIMNTILPDYQVLPMHAGANLDNNNNTSIFFGLSGTGKTTLSTDTGTRLIGDDEIGLSDNGIFNYEGGCYAKTYKLTREGEPEIWDATNRHGAIIENVKVDDQGNIDFFDKSITENGRSSYPLEFIPNIVENGMGPVPNHMFFLSADAFGVLPAVSKLNTNQAMFYFLSGYTAKLAGTEVGISEPQATFSTCFGAPFMMRYPQHYADLMAHYVEKHNIQVWLINTGWTGGQYGEGERFPLKITRQIIRTIQSGETEQIQYQQDPIFGLNFPKEMPGVDPKYLNPQQTWKDPNQYLQSAKKLAQMFHQNASKMNISPEVLKGAPL